MTPEPSFDQIQIRMLKLGVDRPWLADQCDYSPQHLANILAPNGDAKSKTKKALRRIWEALDREELRQSAEAAVPELPAISSLVIRVAAEEFDDWNRAAMAKGKLVSEWAIDSIRDAYAEQNVLKVASPDPSYPSQEESA